MDSVAVVILAGGKNKRMQTDIPKVMLPLVGKPMLAHVLESVEQAGVFAKPTVVVPSDDTAIRSFCGTRVHYAVQEEPLGTGHAVASAKKRWEASEHTLVLYGDMPFVRSESLQRLAMHQRESASALTLMTVTVPAFSGVYQLFSDFGRVIRGKQGAIERIVEMKDATLEELASREVNPSFFCFRTEWLARNLRFLKNNNTQGEYYLTDLVKLAIERDETIQSLDVSPFEAIGINTLEHLEAVNALFVEAAKMSRADR